MKKETKKNKFEEEKATQDMEKLMENLFKKMDKLVVKEWGKPCKHYYWRWFTSSIWDIYSSFKKDLELEYLK